MQFESRGTLYWRIQQVSNGPKRGNHNTIPHSKTYCRGMQHVSMRCASRWPALREKGKGTEGTGKKPNDNNNNRQRYCGVRKALARKTTTSQQDQPNTYICHCANTRGPNSAHAKNVRYQIQPLLKCQVFCLGQADELSIVHLISAGVC